MGTATATSPVPDHSCFPQRLFSCLLSILSLIALLTRRSGIRLQQMRNLPDSDRSTNSKLSSPNPSDGHRLVLERDNVKLIDGSFTTSTFSRDNRGRNASIGVCNRRSSWIASFTGSIANFDSGILTTVEKPLQAKESSNLCRFGWDMGIGM